MGHSGQSKSARNRGRPKIHNEAWTRVSVILFDRQVTFLDRFAAAASADGGRGPSRAEIIRALIDALGDSRIAFPAGASTEDFQALLTARLSKGRPQPGRTIRYYKNQGG